MLFLHNRKLGPGRRDGDMDDVAIAPSGIYVIDAKRYQNAAVRVRRTGGLLSPVKEQLMVPDATGPSSSTAAPSSLPPCSSGSR